MISLSNPIEWGTIAIVLEYWRSRYPETKSMHVSVHSRGSIEQRQRDLFLSIFSRAIEGSMVIMLNEVNVPPVLRMGYLVAC